jgi:ADP-glucose pyrophosphorylase
MPRPKVLALVMAGGEGSRLELLTERRAKPALPYAGVYRLIDFPMSNCVHPWDLDRTYGGLRLLPPQLGAGESDGFHEGNADAIWRNRELIAQDDAETTLVLSADHVYRLDHGEVLARHRERGAGVTVVTSEVPEPEASRQAVVEVAGYWRDVGTVPAYWQAHMDLLDPERPLDLDDPDWPILGRAPHRLPARVEGAVLDRGVRVGPDARAGRSDDDGDPALVGEETRVPRGATVAPGGRLGQDGAREPAA